MARYGTRSDGDEHHVCRDGEPIGPSFPTWGAADRFAALLNTPRRLMIVVARSSYTKGSWDTYTKTFCDTVEITAIDGLGAWWNSLPGDNYTRRRAAVRVYDITGRELSILAPTDPERVTRGVATVTAEGAQVSFAPDVVRRRIAAAGGSTGDLSDEALLLGARVVLARDRDLWALVDGLDEEIARMAAHVQAPQPLQDG